MSEFPLLRKLLNNFFNYKDMHPFFAEGMRKLVSSNLILKSKWYKKYVMKRAQEIQIETPGISIETILNCNAKCQMCGHSNTKLTGLMTMELFKKVIDDCYENNITKVELSVYGEPSIDPYLIDRIQYLRSYEMKYSFTTNASKLTKDMSKKLIELGGLDKIHFSANALDPNIYHKVMGGKLTQQESYKNILDFIGLKNSMNKSDIWVVISTVKLHVNEKDIPAFTQFWLNQKGVNQIIRHDLDDKVGYAEATEIGKLTNFSRRSSFRLPCRFLWGRLYVYNDGRVGVCCQDWDKRQIIVGDMKIQSIKEINNGSALNDLRRTHATGLRHTHPVCGKCNLNVHWFYDTTLRKEKEPATNE